MVKGSMTAYIDELVQVCAIVCRWGWRVWCGRWWHNHSNVR